MKLNKKSTTQRNFEGFEDDFNEWLEAHPKGESNFYGGTVRAAVKNGWFVDVPDDYDVGDQDPAEIARLAIEIDKFYAEKKKIDPNS